MRVDEIILFGSIARGDYAEDSDIDLVIVSRDWEGMGMEERMAMLYRLWDKPRDATLIPLTPRELDEKKERSIVVSEALREGIRIYPRRMRRG